MWSSAATTSVATSRTAFAGPSRSTIRAPRPAERRQPPSTLAPTLEVTLPTGAAVTSSNDDPVIRGSLTDGAGNAVPGATVCIYQTARSARRVAHELATSVTTQGERSLRHQSSSAGPRASVDVVYRYNTKGPRRPRRARLRRSFRRSRSPVKKLANGAISAPSLADLPGPNADGRAVALQARVGRKWRTFKQLRTDSDRQHSRGRYRFTLRLSDGVRYLSSARWSRARADIRTSPARRASASSSCAVRNPQRETASARFEMALLERRGYPESWPTVCPVTVGAHVPALIRPWARAAFQPARSVRCMVDKVLPPPLIRAFPLMIRVPGGQLLLAVVLE